MQGPSSKHVNCRIFKQKSNGQHSVQLAHKLQWFYAKKEKHKQIFECNSNLMKSTLLNFEVEATQNNFSQVVFQ